jgi:hypothetical protein
VKEVTADEQLKLINNINKKGFKNAQITAQEYQMHYDFSVTAKSKSFF